ncbi:hypothetical protein CTH30272_02124 [Allocatenococcus thiocycli]|nr:hypothetical protein CTH30272_02124 [Catenococcus thiocycli]
MRITSKVLQSASHHEREGQLLRAALFWLIASRLTETSTVRKSMIERARECISSVFEKRGNDQ